MADAKGADQAAGRGEQIVGVPFKQRLLLSLVSDVDQLSFQYRSGALSAEEFVVAVRDRVDAMLSVTRNVRVRSHLAHAETLMESDVLHLAADRVASLAGPADLERAERTNGQGEEGGAC